VKLKHWFLSTLFAGLLFTLGFLLGERGKVQLPEPQEKMVIIEQTHKITRKNLDDPVQTLLKPGGSL